MVHGLRVNLHPRRKDDQAHGLQEWHYGGLVIGCHGVSDFLPCGFHAPFPFVLAGLVCGRLRHHHSAGCGQSIHLSVGTRRGGFEPFEFGTGFQLAGYHHRAHCQCGLPPGRYGQNRTGAGFHVIGSIGALSLGRGRRGASAICDAGGGFPSARLCHSKSLSPSHLGRGRR